jgi:hypothetical protein
VAVHLPALHQSKEEIATVASEVGVNLPEVGQPLLLVFSS